MKIPQVFIDSGAYSAHTKGAVIEMAAYAEFVKEHRKYITIAANLDDLTDPAITWRNQQDMESRVDGVPVLPTFHFGEPIEWLTHYVRHYDYIALGGQVGQSAEQLMFWLDELWDKYLTDVNGYPLVRVHAFGVTSVPIMRRYPWYSVDSTSWIMAAATGKAMFCRTDPNNGLPHLAVLSVSDKSPAKDQREQHVDSLTPAQREGFMKLVHEQGFNLEELQTDYKKRFLCNATAYVTLASRIKYKRFDSGAMSLFAEPKEVERERVAPWETLTLYLAGNPGAREITKQVMLKGYHRLLSYHYITQGAHWKEAREVIDGWENA